MPERLLEEIEQIAELIRSGGLTTEAARDQLGRVFRDLQRRRSQIDRAHTRARSLLLSLARAENRTDTEDQAGTIASAIRKGIEEDALTAVEALADSGNALARGLRLHIAGKHADAATILGSGNAHGALARLVALRAQVAALLEDAGHAIGLPLPDSLPVTEELFERLRGIQGEIAQVARGLAGASWEAAFGRLVLAEVLLTARRFDAAAVTLSPLLEEGHLVAAAEYLLGVIRFRSGDRARARAAWLSSARRPDSIHAKWSEKAAEALSVRKNPDLPALLGPAR